MHRVASRYATPVMASDASRSATELVVLRSDPSAVRQARHLARKLCEAVGLPLETQDAVVLLTSETVTNALLHGRGHPLLTLSARDGGVRICVGDDSGQFPVDRKPGEGAVGGRGVQLLNACADEWGVTLDGRGGKVVWFECSAKSVWE